MKTAVKDVMTTRVIWVRKDAPFRDLAVAMRRHRVSAFPVLGDDDKVIGVVSEADMLTKEAVDPGVISGILHHRDAEKARGTTAGSALHGVSRSARGAGDSAPSFGASSGTAMTTSTVRVSPGATRRFQSRTRCP